MLPGWLAERIGRWLAGYLEKPVAAYRHFSVSDPETLATVMKPGDVLLVEGDQRISVAIKYLTQSTWSHAAIFVGDALADQGKACHLIEADLRDGVVAVPLAKYAGSNTRICRPVGLSDTDCRSVVDFLVKRLGHSYDLKNVIDLARFLLPTPPVPARFRRDLLALGSGDPTRAICSTLIVQAFQSVRYPVLPHVQVACDQGQVERSVLRLRHHSLFTPRDFDLSPYFRVVKPTIEQGFEYRDLVWQDIPDPE